MNTEVYQHKPILLVTSHCLPACCGNRDQKRVWQLLKTGLLTHHVCLAATVKNPVNLHQWQEANRLADHVFIETKSRFSPYDRIKSHELLTWLQRHKINTVISNTQLWPVASRINAAMHIYDCNIPASRIHNIQAAQVRLPLRWWYILQARRARQLETQASRQANIVLLSKLKDASRFLTRARRTEILPANDSHILYEILRNQATIWQARHAIKQKQFQAMRPAA